jgi:predicted ATPase
MRLVWSRRTRRGFFLRAEDFFGYVKRVNAELAHHRDEAARVRAESAHLPEGEIARIASPFTGSEAALASRYGADADARSHGEQFLAFFSARLAPDGLYLLDEPEAPLSPSRQLALLSMLREASEQRGCQFVIATHSPILMALPGAAIVSFDAIPPRVVAWDELESVRLVRDFLVAPERYLRHL